MVRQRRALCPHCDITHAVRGDGTFRPHMRGGQPCPGVLELAPEQPGQSADEYIAANRDSHAAAEQPPTPVGKYGDARLLADIAAGRVWSDGNGVIWRGDRWSRAGSKSHAGPAVRTARDHGWSAVGADGVEVLTGDGRAALAVWDADHQDAGAGAVTVR